ncbi:hypothetical protein EDD16DRAFT_652465 [Pisolithus croceorrhizus]|nr:hypothetical protein EDD16DRAFT_652465 [Pisolithus croceorrhizus]
MSGSLHYKRLVTSASPYLINILPLYCDKMTFYTWERILFMACVWFSGDYQSTNPPSWPTVMGIKHSDERVAFRVIEFWSTSCEEEIEFCSHSTRSTLPGFVDFVAQIRTGYILSFRLLIMAILPRAFSSLLDSSLVRKRMPIRMNEIYPCLLAIIPFIEAHIKSSVWHQWATAVVAFGSTLDDPDRDGERSSLFRT